MRRSKLEMYERILSVLVYKGPSKKTHIMQRVDVNYKVLKKSIEFLIEQGLVEERIVGEGIAVYATTSRGMVALKNLNELQQVARTLHTLSVSDQSRKDANLFL